MKMGTDRPVNRTNHSLTESRRWIVADAEATDAGDVKCYFPIAGLST